MLLFAAFAVIGTCVVPFVLIEAAITVAGKPCGDSKYCSLLEYCSSIHSQCENCATVCTPSKHNFDQVICTSQCQDYLHEIRYAKVANYTADIERLQKQQTVLLILLVILFILFTSVHGLHLIRWLRKKDYLSFSRAKHLKSVKKNQIHATEITVANPHTQSPKLNLRRNNGGGAVVSIGGGGGVGDIPPPIAGVANINSVYSASGIDGSTMHTVSTPISNRYPAEDTVMSYSYDNAAMQLTPVSDIPKSETKF